jgi:hypothetical protein
MPPAYVAWRVGTTNRVIVPARQAENRFLAPLKVYKYGLRNRFKGIDSASLCSPMGRYVKLGCRSGPPGGESIPAYKYGLWYF